MEKSKKWIIVLQENSPAQLIKKQITSYGFKVEQVLEEIGCITGSSTLQVANKIKSLSGVADVSSEEGEINIGPPDSPISW